MTGGEGDQPLDEFYWRKTLCYALFCDRHFRPILELLLRLPGARSGLLSALGFATIRVPVTTGMTVSPSPFQDTLDAPFFAYATVCRAGLLLQACCRAVLSRLSSRSRRFFFPFSNS